jgi:general secretion pathway protein A
MYRAYFGLKKGLFDNGIAKEESVFVGPRQQLIVANFKVALTTFDSAIVLTGPAGVGKTTLTAAALRTTSTRLALGWLGHTATNGSELLETLLAEFGFSAHRASRVERLQMWRQFLSEMNATDSRVFVIAERADALDVEVLRALETVTAADPNGCAGANLVLLGQTGLIEHLKAPALASLQQRVRLRQALEPFSLDELKAYLQHRIALAGGNFDAVFTDGAIASLYQYAGGCPRAVNNLCETALTLAATGDEQKVTPELLRRVAVGLYGFEAATSYTGPATIDAAPAAVLLTVAAPIPVGVTTPASAAIRHESALSPAPVAVTPLDLPVLTDAIFEPPPPAAPRPAPPSVVAAARTSAQTVTAPAPRPAPVKRAFAAAQSVHDVSSTMAETLFGDDEFEMLSAALASAGWPDDESTDELLDDLANTPVEESITMETPQGAFEAFGRSDAMLELVDDAPGTAHEERPMAAAKR